MGLEYISQPQIFLSPITAVGGIQNGLFNSSLPPLYTSFYTWTSTSSVTATQFPLNGIETLTDRSGSFIVTVGGVVQSPQTYIIDVNNRTLTFDTPVKEDAVVLITQIGTIAVSSQSISELTATNSLLNNIIGINSVLTNVTGTNNTFINATITDLQVLSSQFFGTTVFDTVTATNLVVLSSVTQVRQTVITQTSGISLTAIGASTFNGTISATGLVTFDSNLIVGGNIYAQNGNSITWNNTTTLLQNNSGNWNSTFSSVCSLSDKWNSNYNTVNNLSSDWESVYSLVNAQSGIWYAGYDASTILNSNSANWNTAYQIATALSSEFIPALNNNIVNLSSVSTVFANTSSNWETTYQTVYTLSGNWEESADILPTVTNYLSTNLVTVSSLNVTEQMLSANTNLFNLFLTPANTLTTSICAMSGDGVTPFVMQFTNGLLTSLTV